MTTDADKYVWNTEDIEVEEIEPWLTIDDGETLREVTTLEELNVFLESASLTLEQFMETDLARKEMPDDLRAEIEGS